MRMTPPQSMSRWASFHTSTRRPGRNSSSPPPRATACGGGSIRPPVHPASSGVVSQTVMVPAKTASVQISRRVGRPSAASLPAISASRIGSRSSSGGKARSSRRQPTGIMSSEAGTPYAIQRRNVISTPASSRR